MQEKAKWNKEKLSKTKQNEAKRSKLNKAKQSETQKAKDPHTADDAFFITYKTAKSILDVKKEQNVQIYIKIKME